MLAGVRQAATTLQTTRVILLGLTAQTLRDAKGLIALASFVIVIGRTVVTHVVDSELVDALKSRIKSVAA